MDAQKKKMLRLVGNNLRQWRREKGFGLHEFAQILGISAKTLNHYEAGRVDIPLSRLLLICQKLGITPDTITGGIEHAEYKQREVAGSTHNSNS